MTNNTRFELVNGEVARVVLEDRESHNTFTPSFVASLRDAFDEVGRNDQLKVVVVHGYDNYFCCGASKEELLKISAGQAKFDELNFYRLLLDCEIPVIAAMQGHAIGGGLVFGSYADMMVLGRECIYSANFMAYGFTPGMGGTYIIPHKFGHSIGGEMLLTAENYYGNDLEKRGVPLTVVSKKIVIDTALDLALNLARKPKIALTLLKRQLCQKIACELPQYIESELQMHNVCFNSIDIKNSIMQHYGN